MGKKEKVKLFISYSHEDEHSYIEKFKIFLKPLEDNNLIKNWYDRKILPGSDFEEEIDNNIEDADIICLCISKDFLASEYCLKEKKKAFALKKKKNINVIPIILSNCGWQDHKDLKKLLALPTDGKPISNYKNKDDALKVVYDEIKKIIEKENEIRNLELKDEFEEFLNSSEMFTKANSNKEKVELEDILIYPELNKFNELKEFDEKINSKNLIDNILEYSKIAIAGEEQSSKTTLCKVIYKKLRQLNFIPIYLFDKQSNFLGKMENRIKNAFNEQYKNFDTEKIDSNRIVPIVDDFHFARNKEKHINYLSKYGHCVIIIDDIFSLNIKDKQLLGSFSYFQIREFKPSLRYELIKKWVSLTDKNGNNLLGRNKFYQDIDKNIEIIDTTLGKTIGRGIMPAYPFYMLSAIVTYEIFGMPLNEEITSQGYCYQALIYLYLRNKKVKNDEIDIYINFLSEIAFHFYKNKVNELSIDAFGSFMEGYLKKYNLPIKQKVLLSNLEQIISLNSFNNYIFRYPYIYYFFVAKYLSDHMEVVEIKKEIENIIENLHINENAYIAIFISHHSKNIELLEEIKLNAMCVFDEYNPATLSKNEVSFFDKASNVIIKASLPPHNKTPEDKRAEDLKIKDDIEESKENKVEERDKDQLDDFGIELRRSIKTVEVMGHIIKNRSGSLEKKQLEEIFQEAMNVHLRILTSFFNLIKTIEGEKSIVNFISDVIKKDVMEKTKKPSKEERESIARIIFWNINFFVVLGNIIKIVHSLGSDKLIKIIKKVTDEINTPASFLVKHGILMCYNKNLDIDELSEAISRKNFSEIAKRAIKFLVVRHCSIHEITYKDRQKLESKLDISAKKLLIAYSD